MPDKKDLAAQIDDLRERFEALERRVSDAHGEGEADIGRAP